jgi:iron complex outermembrane receptor protein
MMGIMLYQGFKMFQGNTLTVGMDYFQYGGKGSPITTVSRDDDGEVIMPPSFGLSAFDNRWITMSNTAFYVSAQQILFQKLILNGGIRYEMNDTYGSEWIPQFGLSWNPFATTTLKGSVSKGYRPPSIRELYLFPPANDILTPERMVSYEIGWTQRWLRGKMRTELVGYVCDGSNMIVMVPPVAPPPPRYMNTGSFHNSGIEFSLDYNPIAALNLHANYAYIHMREPLPATPEHNLFLSGTYRFRKFAFHLKVQHIFNLYNETSEGIEIIERSYHVLNARIAYQATDFLNLYVTGHNLLNQDYQINDGYPMPGATVFAGLHLKLSRNNKQD